MSSPENEKKEKSVFLYAAEAGVPMGIYLTAMSMCLLASLRIDSLPLLLLPLLLGLPAVLYFLMRRVRDIDPRCRRVAPLWLMGIYTFIFGTLICVLVSDLYIMWAEPHFVTDYISRAIADMKSLPAAPQLSEQADLLQAALDSHALPSSMQFVASMGWATCFFGSMLSLLMAALLTFRAPGRLSGSEA